MFIKDCFYCNPDRKKTTELPVKPWAWPVVQNTFGHNPVGIPPVWQHPQKQNVNCVVRVFCQVFPHSQKCQQRYPYYPVGHQQQQLSQDLRHKSYEQQQFWPYQNKRHRHFDNNLAWRQPAYYPDMPQFNGQRRFGQDLNRHFNTGQQEFGPIPLRQIPSVPYSIHPLSDVYPVTRKCQQRLFQESNKQQQFRHHQNLGKHPFENFVSQRQKAYQFSQDLRQFNGDAPVSIDYNRPLTFNPEWHFSVRR